MQSLQQQNAGYDRASTVFSPDGRLFQVEYAREAVKRGTTSLGVKSNEGIVLLVDKKNTSKLIETESIEKIYQIDKHIGAATSGLVADARALIDRARVEAQINKLTYDEAISAEGLAKKICELKQLYTQNGGARPFGVSLIIGGVNKKGCGLFETDPSGALVEYKATAIGQGRKEAMKYFEENYTEDLTIEDAVNLSLDAIYSANEGDVEDSSIEIAIINKDGYSKLSRDKIEEYIKELKERNKEE